MPEAAYCKSNRWLTVILITPEQFGADRESVRLALEAENIESRPVWKPMHMQPVLNTQIPSIESQKPNTGKPQYKCRVIGGNVAEDLFNRGLCLPSGTAMTPSDQNHTIETIQSPSAIGTASSEPGGLPPPMTHFPHFIIFPISALSHFGELNSNYRVTQTSSKPALLPSHIVTCMPSLAE